MHKNEPDCYEINVQIAQKTLEFVEKDAYNESQYTDIEELRRMSHESFGIKVSEPSQARQGYVRLICPEHFWRSVMHRAVESVFHVV